MLLIVLFCRRVSSVPLISARSRQGRKQSIFPLIVLRYYFYSSQMTCKYNIKNELNRNDGHVFILSGRHTVALRVLPCRRNVPQRMSPCRRLRLGTGMSGTMLTLKNILHKYAFCSTAQRIFIHRNPTRASYLLRGVRYGANTRILGTLCKWLTVRRMSFSAPQTSLYAVAEKPVRACRKAFSGTRNVLFSGTDEAVWRDERAFPAS